MTTKTIDLDAVEELAEEIEDYDGLRVHKRKKTDGSIGFCEECSARREAAVIVSAAGLEETVQALCAMHAKELMV